MRMTPYDQQQLLLAALSAALALGVELALGRVRALRERPWTRLASAYALLAAPLACWVVLVRAVDHSHSTFQFASVAIGYYAGAFMLPFAAAVRAVRAPRRPWGLLAACATAWGVGLWALLVEPNRLVTVERELRFPNWPADCAPLRVVHISDLQSVGACEREREAARRINALRPDLIVFTGDYAAGPFRDPTAALSAARAFFAALETPRLGIVCVPGHAERERHRAQIFEGFAITYLRNSEVELELDPSEFADSRKLRIFGARTLHEGYDLSSYYPRREPGVLNLVASHEPDVVWDLLDRPVDLHLCGHTHGGQIVVPFFGAPMTLSSLPRHFARGLHAVGSLWVHVNPGIGMEGNFAPRIRLFCPPQIDLLVLRGGGERPAGAVPARS